MTAACAVTTALCPAVVANGAAGAARHRPGERITVSKTTCAPRWRAPNPGRAHFEIVNQARRSLTMYLFRPVSDHVVGSVKDVPPGHSRTFTVHLRPGGHYIWSCDLKGAPERLSDAETVPLDPTHGGRGPAVVPVTRDQLVAPMRAYRHYVSQQLSLLGPQVKSLADELADGRAIKARSEWLTAHRTWLRIGQDDGAYSAFGTLGLAIDGPAQGLTGGTSDPAFTGFHKIELDLWTRRDPTAAHTDTLHLEKLLGRITAPGLPSWFPMTTASVSGLPLRTHEVLEDALRDTLSGDDDYGSGTGLASVRSDVGAVRELLGLVAPLLAPRAPHLVAHAERSLDRLARVVEQSRSGRHWVAVDKLPRANREAVDAAIGSALERLAPIPDLLTIGKS